MRTILTAELFADVTYVALNLGEGYGVLSAIDPATARPPTIRDVALFTTLPNDLGHVAGVISATPQTPLSHINLKAKQNDTPNAYVRDAATDPRIAALLGQVVRYAVTPDDFELAAATPERGRGLARADPPDAAADAAARPDARRRSATSTSSATATSQRVGAKAANVAELRKMLPAGTVPDGYAIPFALYDAFMTAGGFYDRARAIIADPELAGRRGQAREALDELRKQIKKADLPPEHRAAITELQARFPAGPRHPLPLVDEQRGPRGLQRRRPVRLVHAPRRRGRPRARPSSRCGRRCGTCAPSTSATSIASTTWRRRWACSCTRTSTTRSPTASPSRRTRSTPTGRASTSTSRSARALVTNPDPNATPDELLVSAIGPNGEYETQYIRRSTLTTGRRRAS